jgi:hypothetical protein
MLEKVPDIKPSRENYSALVNSYEGDPVSFSREICGVEPLEWQKRFLDALLGRKFIARPSGHSTGKTKITCVAMLWMLLCFRDCHIRATSATFDQLRNVMWQELRKTLSLSAVSLWCEIDETKVVNRLLPYNWIRAVAWSPDKPQAWAGEHCHSPVGVFDECSDIDRAIFEAWAGSSHHEGSRTILLGQPRLRSGMLYEASRSKDYDVEHVSSVSNKYAPAGFVEQSARDYGEESDFYRIRVLGQFPAADSSAMFPSADSKRLEDLPKPEGVAVAGLDVAGPGKDFSVLAIRKGDAVVLVRKWKEPDHAALCRMALDALRYHGCRVVAVDANGIGYGISQFMRREPWLSVIPVVGSEKATNWKKYHDRRSEAYGRLSDIWGGLRFARGGVSPDDLRGIAVQLSAIRIYVDRHSRISVSELGDIKRELKGQSPDLASALSYCAIPQMAAMPQEEREEVELPGTRSRYG